MNFEKQFAGRPIEDHAGFYQTLQSELFLMPTDGVTIERLRRFEEFARRKIGASLWNAVKDKKFYYGIEE